MVSALCDVFTGTCCCPTGFMKPTPLLLKRLRRPEVTARDTVVLPTCCFVAATNIARFVIFLNVLFVCLLIYTMRWRQAGCSRIRTISS
mmetsp:Transcript_32372/g.46954  ORF Transcript_32372/g.46954 Transcript_32372/m.46954 type:complete len:89 (+) Transcript_32372:1046-1312(+)